MCTKSEKALLQVLSYASCAAGVANWCRCRQLQEFRTDLHRSPKQRQAPKLADYYKRLAIGRNAGYMQGICVSNEVCWHGWTICQLITSSPQFVVLVHVSPDQPAVHKSVRFLPNLSTGMLADHFSSDLYCRALRRERSICNQSRCGRNFESIHRSGCFVA